VNRGELVAKLKSLGHDYLSDATAADMIDQAAKDFVGEDLWPFRLVTVSVASSGDTVAGLGPIESVDVNGGLLDESSRKEALERYGLLTTGGQPVVFWVEGEKVYFYPTGGPVSVRHYSYAAWAVGGEEPTGNTDILAAPKRFHDIVILRAREFAYEAVDEEEHAGAMNVRYQARCERMRETLIRDRVVGPARVKQTREWV
jgi:hypothetical protein